MQFTAVPQVHYYAHTLYSTHSLLGTRWQCIKHESQPVDERKDIGSICCEHVSALNPTWPITAWTVVELSTPQSTSNLPSVIFNFHCSLKASASKFSARVNIISPNGQKNWEPSTVMSVFSRDTREFSHWRPSKKKGGDRHGAAAK